MPDEQRGVSYPLYERVLREMAFKGWTATRLQAETGLSRSTLNKWASQARTPLPEKVNAVADALGIDRAEALRLAGILQDSAPPNAPPVVREHWNVDAVRTVWQNEDLAEEDRLRMIQFYAVAVQKNRERADADVTQLHRANGA